MRIGLGTFVKTIDVNNTAEPFRTAGQPPVFAQEIMIMADSSNLNPVYIGGSDVTSTNGFPLSPGIVISLGGILMGSSKQDLSLLDCYVYGTAGEKIRVILGKSVDASV